MLGSGVGYNIQREYVDKLPSINAGYVAPIKQDDSSAEFICPDTREGWVELLAQILGRAFATSESKSVGALRYSTQLVRGKGERIKGFGGIASGPEDLCIGIGEIGRVLEGRRGQKLRPIDCLDIMNIIGQIVVSGNVRRSAQLALGDYDDVEFLRAKRWDLGSIPNWRQHSNNSIVCGDVRLLGDDFWDGYRGKGEPYGLINLDLARACGRLGESQYPDPGVCGFNPCAEQGLADRETCCLAEVFLPNVASFGELLDVLRLLYRVCKHSLALPCHHRDTQAIVQKNFRMGIGMAGYLQATEEQRTWLSEAYTYLRNYDKEYSEAHGFPLSIKLTTEKPGGTLPLLPGVTPGCHGAWDTFMIRRIRLASNSPLLDTIRSHGYKVEPQRNFDGSCDPTTCVAEFPFAYPKGTPTSKSLSAVDQLEVVRRIQREWSDNAVSCTVSYKASELGDIREYLAEYYMDNFKSLSFLLHEDHGFDQAPLESITEEYYNELVSKTRPITSLTTQVEFTADDGCESTGMCPIK